MQEHLQGQKHCIVTGAYTLSKVHTNAVAIYHNHTHANLMQLLLTWRFLSFETMCSLFKEGMRFETDVMQELGARCQQQP